jgi:catechol 2,3-dioxygenase-like lactoylglutathione lyase family enzyme
MATTSRFASIRIITADIRRLVAFYETVTGLDATWATDEFAEFRWPLFTLAIGSTATLALFGGDVAQAAANRSVIVEFLVDDADSDYQRLLAGASSVTVVQPPTTMPWGNRSVLLRDPDGNLVNLFTPPVAGRHVPDPH